jgi:hypothetical protein
MPDQDTVQDQLQPEPKQKAEDQAQPIEQIYRHGKFEIQVREIKAPVRPRGVLAE